MGNVNDILRNLRIHQQKYLVLSNILLIMNKIGGESPHQLGWTRVCRPAQYGFYAYIDRFDICKFIVCKKRNIVNKKRIKFWKFLEIAITQPTADTGSHKPVSPAAGAVPERIGHHRDQRVPPVPAYQAMLLSDPPEQPYSSSHP